MKPHHAVLFQPTTIGSIHVKNRYAMAPMGPLGLATAEGGWNQRGIEYYTTRARGGIGLIITGVCQVTNPADNVPTGMLPNPVQSPGNFIRTSRELTERVHAFDAKIVLQVGAGFGRVIVPSVLRPGDRPASASEIPYKWDPSLTCRELTHAEIRAVVDNFRVAGAVAKKAGFDGIQVHAVHEGYLLDQFAIEFFNRRTDEYGGSLENRLRFTRECVEAIHQSAGDDYPVQLRFSPKSMIKDWNEGAMPGEDFVERGRDIDEGIAAARLLHSYGYEALDVDVGSYDSWYWSHPPMYQAKGLYVPYARQVKDAVPEVPLIVAGRLDDPDLAASIVGDGTADLVSLGRPALADPEIVNKIAAGRTELIRPCISCQEGCIGRIAAYTSLRCAVNPQACREADIVLHPASSRRRKKVMIIGAGLAGLEAARVLAERDHEPVVYERSDHVGGVVVAGGQPSFKEDDLALLAYYDATLRELGVEVHLNTEVTPEMVADTDADHILVCTGSTPHSLALGAGVPVVEAVDALMDPAALGQRVAIVGGGLTGCELGISLRDKGRDVTVIEAMPDILQVSGPLCHANHEMLHTLVPYRGIDVIRNGHAVRVTDEGLLVEAGGQQRLVACDTVVTAIGYRPDQELWKALADSPKPRHLLGDARRTANILYAVWDAFEVAYQL
ncbi:FAD-dependent oxidoreductase [Propionicicella superfundia]|uniref:oxidoreductase n=1 Tax=Propionicicella superfundia TaxID=348582 RepID=UPI0003FF7727|nr:FAD-dependent oxidoreductase [Propionicicella superfundia]